MKKKTTKKIKQLLTAFLETRDDTNIGGWWCTKHKLTEVVFDSFIKWLDETDGKPTEYELRRAKALTDLRGFDWNLLSYSLLEEIHGKIKALLNYVP